MKWVKYLYRTPLTQICADLSEYMDLRGQCAVLRNERRAAYERIVTIVNGIEKKSGVPSCVCQEYYNNMQFYNHRNDSIADNMMWVRYVVCRKFDSDNSGVKCSRVGCPWINQNHEYADACARYNIMRQVRRDFWRVKFAKAMQNVK